MRSRHAAIPAGARATRSASSRASTCPCAPASTARSSAAPTRSAARLASSCVRIAIKRVPGGALLQLGQRHPGGRRPRSTSCRRPGASCCPRATGAPRHIVAFAAGAGITPILAMIEHALATEPATSFTLVYGNRSPDSIMFRQRAGGPEGPLPRPLHAAPRALAQRGVERAAVRGPHHRRQGQGARREPVQARRRWRMSSCAGRAR